MESRLHDLITLANEPSSEKRRELLRGVTDMFFTGDGHSAVEMELFDDVLSQLAGDMEEAVKAELAQRLGEAPTAPRGLSRALAHLTEQAGLAWTRQQPIAIGGPTAATLAELGYPAAAVAAAPTPEGILTATLGVIHD